MASVAFDVDENAEIREMKLVSMIMAGPINWAAMIMPY
jgi:hypothetical protein